MSPPIRIGIVGKMGSGKSTAAKYLEAKYGFHRLSFAMGVKEIAKKYFGMGKKNRCLLQSIGMKMREIMPHVWIAYTFNNIHPLIWNCCDLVIEDVRFENEAAYLRQEKFILLRVVRSKGRKAVGMEFADDKSETELEGICTDYIFNSFEEDNEKWKRELYDYIDKILFGQRKKK